ncbi:hypothetical protein NSZ01_12170 [Nocardioides szechwanensis]|uniref:Uncharacterized protein n=1 Tax=Nocardioides szechwanensis TaxID=1005944 RepID=A0A1H0CEQ5_9ACTN|nr:hypothetical protein [Nocardioides szechwanensis]GEP33449.1 hypothetical protein NSZ01_12170 [Nocardioides szechwanensis]SDN56360.1 hypothetical protein SAMN05192576_2404 [Nocardioides szechwanensis]
MTSAALSEPGLNDTGSPRPTVALRVVVTYDDTTRRVDLELGGAESDSPGQFWQVATNHSYTEYASSVRSELATNSEAAHILRDYQSTLAPFLVTPGGTATAVDVPVSRGD